MLITLISCTLRSEKVRRIKQQMQFISKTKFWTWSVLLCRQSQVTHELWQLSYQDINKHNYIVPLCQLVVQSYNIWYEVNPLTPTKCIHPMYAMIEFSDCSVAWMTYNTLNSNNGATHYVCFDVLSVWSLDWLLYYTLNKYKGAHHYV